MPSCRRFCCLLATLVAFAACGSARAQTAELTAIRDVVALDGLATGQSPRPVRLQGVVTEVAPGADSFGLGLVIVRRCVELHGGSIGFTGEAPTRTTFTVRLPLFGNPA